MNSASLIWGVLFGSIGLGFFIYGKKQHHLIALLCGVGLMVLPYLISNAALLVLAGAALVAAPFIIKP